ncbi:MAG TPA: methyltransferase domain-containing protein [Terriglobia bacterium]|nr:methyltransferase domain-containing protein [Terriglobia bacterium]
MPVSKKHTAIVQKQFTATADAYSKHAARDTPEIVSERVAFAGPQPDDAVLDVACGPGAWALEIAPRVRSVQGADLTRAMLQEALEFQRERRISNAGFIQGDAEQLPYPDRAFDLVACHFAFHHMPKPEAALKEMLRVLKPQGRVMLADSLGPESDEKWEFQHRIQQARDPSHTGSLRLTTFLKFFDDLGLIAIRQSVKRRQRSFNHWMRRAGLEHADARYQQTRKLVEEAVPGDKASLAAQIDGDDLTIVHPEVMFLLKRKQPM